MKAYVYELEVERRRDIFYSVGKHQAAMPLQYCSCSIGTAVKEMVSKATMLEGLQKSSAL